MMFVCGLWILIGCDQMIIPSQQSMKKVRERPAQQPPETVRTTMVDTQPDNKRENLKKESTATLPNLESISNVTDVQGVQSWVSMKPATDPARNAPH
jgi:hypothetical protein